MIPEAAVGALAEIINATDLIGCGCCGASTEVQVGPEDWEVEYPAREEALARAILAAGYRIEAAK